MPKMILMFLLSITLIFEIVSHQCHKIEMDVVFCDLSFPEIFKYANCSFTIYAFFELDKNGKPTIITIAGPKQEIVSLDEVKNCLLKWKIRGFTQGTKISAIWSWKHGKGWRPLIIYAPNFKQIINARNIWMYVLLKRLHYFSRFVR